MRLNSISSLNNFDESGDTKPTGDNMRKRGEKVADNKHYCNLRIKMKTHTTTAHPKLSLMIVHEC